jgi:hypothetical protein
LVGPKSNRILLVFTHVGMQKRELVSSLSTCLLFDPCPTTETKAKHMHTRTVLRCWLANSGERRIGDKGAKIIEMVICMKI